MISYKVKDFKQVGDFKNIEALRDQFKVMGVAAVVEWKLIYSSKVENYLEVINLNIEIFKSEL